MKMKFLVSLILGVLPLTMMAQDDDMYFVPAKKSKVTTVRPVRPAPVYYSGSNRSVDEYNRRGGSSYEVVSTDTAKNDIIDFKGEVGVYPDSTMQQEDFALTREMSRWDGYEPVATYMEGYRDGRYDALWGWHSPWYYSYYPWYDPWYDPWYGYRGWYSSLYDPWYYDRWYYGGYYGYYGGWYRPYYYGPVHTVTYIDNGRRYRESRMVSETRRGVSNGRTTRFNTGTFGGAALNNRNTATRSSRTVGTTTTTRPTTTVTNSHGTFAGRATMPTTTTPTTTSSRSSSGTFGGGGVSTRSMGGGGSFGGGGGGGGVSTRGGSRSSRR